jgi:HNH endonuclease
LSADLSSKVWQIAEGHCEYCQLPASRHPAPFQIDHVIARQHGGLTIIENLALACIHCNRFKGPNIAGVDPQTGEIVRLFHPRLDTWAEHFAWDGANLVGLTAIGRATITVLLINDPELVAVRTALREETSS